MSLILPTLERRPFLHSLIRFFRAGIANPARLKNLLSVRRVKNFLEIIVERGPRGDSALQRYESILKTDDGASSFISTSKGVDEDIAPDRIVLRTSSDPIVSVVIPVFNQAKYTLNCLKSISENIPKTPFEVIVIDDCSSDETPELLEEIRGLRILRNSTNLGFLMSCNVAAKSCEGHFIFLLTILLNISLWIFLG